MGVQDAILLFTEPNVRFGAELGAKGATILGIVINVIFLGLVFYKMMAATKRSNRISRRRTRLRVDKG